MSEEINNNEPKIKSILQGIQVLVRGKDPDNFEQKCLDLCRKYLPTYWQSLTLQDVEVVRLTGGMTNQIYRCKALATNEVEDSETQEVVIRFYGDKHDLKTCAKGDRYFDGVVAWNASFEGLGPKVHGIFPEGQILKYYRHRLMEEYDLIDPNTSIRVAQMLAKFHSLRPPMPRHEANDWFMWFAKNNHDDYYDQFVDKYKSLIENNGCKTLLNSDLKSEILWLKERIASFESPIIFSHNDFRIGNILMADTEQIVLTDFDYSVYAHRGYDLASLFLNFDKGLDKKFEFKDESIVRQFIASYVRQCEQISGTEYAAKEINSVEHVLIECKRFLLCVCMFWIYIFVGHGHEFPIDQDSVPVLVEQFVAKYYAVKAMLEDETLI